MLAFVRPPATSRPRLHLYIRPRPRPSAPAGLLLAHTTAVLHVGRPFEGEFENKIFPPPLFQRKSSKGLTSVLLIIAFAFLAVDVIAATFMIIAVVVPLLGSYSSSKAPRSVSSTNAGRLLGGISKTMLGTQGGGLGTYVVALFIAVTDTGVSTTPTSTYGE